MLNCSPACTVSKHGEKEANSQIKTQEAIDDGCVENESGTISGRAPDHIVLIVFESIKLDWQRM